MREQEEVGLDLLKLILHIILTFMITHTRDLPTPVGNVNPHIIQLHDVERPLARSIAANISEIHIVPFLLAHLLQVLRLVTHHFVELVIHVRTQHPVMFQE